MPTQLSSGKRPKKLPPCGRRDDYQLPHSPFQKLIESARVRRDLSWRDLAGAIGKHPSTIWIWIHNQNGYPAPRSCSPVDLEKLAKFLKLDLAKVQAALDASRHIYTPRANPVPQDVVDAFETLEATLMQIKSRTVRTSLVLDLVRRLAPKRESVKAYRG